MPGPAEKDSPAIGFPGLRFRRDIKKNIFSDGIRMLHFKHFSYICHSKS